MFQDRSPHSPPILFTKKSIDETVVDSDVLQDDDDLTITVRGNQTYALRLVLFGNFTDDEKQIAISGTCTVTDLVLQQTGSDDRVTSLDSPVTVGNWVTAALFLGTVKVNHGGTLKLQWSLTGVTGTASMLAGSFIEAWRLS